MRYRLRLLLTCTFAALAFGCDREESSPRHVLHWVEAEQYLGPDCWGGKDLSETPTKVPVRLFVSRRKESAYVAFASRDCLNNAYGLAISEVPREVMAQDSIERFRVAGWSEAEKDDLAQDLQVREVRTPPVHGMSIEPETEVYEGILEVLESNLREPPYVSDFTIGQLSHLRRRRELEPFVDP